MCAFMLLTTVHGVVLGLRDVCFHVTVIITVPLNVHGVVSGLCDVRFHVALDCSWRCLMTPLCVHSRYF